MGRNKAVVVDLDNCVSNDTWRIKYINKEADNPDDKYRKYHELCGWDLPANLGIVHALSLDHAVIIFTARPECVRKETEQWWAAYGLPLEALFMRPDGNHDPSVVLKRKMLVELDSKYEVVMALDDRVDILDMYAQEGVRCCRRVFIDTNGGHA